MTSDLADSDRSEISKYKFDNFAFVGNWYLWQIYRKLTLLATVTLIVGRFISTLQAWVAPLVMGMDISGVVCVLYSPH